jgi:hypothetical protein
MIEAECCQKLRRIHVECRQGENAPFDEPAAAEIPRDTFPIGAVEIHHRLASPIYSRTRREFWTRDHFVSLQYHGAL